MSISYRDIWSFGLGSILILVGLNVTAQRLDPLTRDNSRKGIQRHKSVNADAIYLPFFDDFARYTGSPDTLLWEVNGGAFVNRQFAINPPSFGIATFDGLDYEGNPYNSADPSASGKTDELLSLPIDLSYYPENVYLSFFYQPTGVGHVQPNPGDSLKVFLKDSSNSWIQVWSVDMTATQDFEQVFVPITDSIYLFDQFQFKFESFGNKSGMYDIWNLDYVYVNDDRSVLDTTFPDVAISNIPNSYLKTYTSMPYYQFLANSAEEVADSLSLTVNDLNYKFPIPLGRKCVLTEIGSAVSNVVFEKDSVVAGGIQQHEVTTSSLNIDLFSDNNDLFVETKFVIGGFDPEIGDTVTNKPILGDTVMTDSGNVVLSSGDGIFVNGVFRRLKDGVNFNLTAGDSLCTEQGNYRVSQNITVDPTGELYLVTTTHTDSITRICELTDYFAYDDGLAEKTFVMDQRWGLVAYRFDLNEDDTLIGVEINFPVTAKGASSASIDLVVWQDLQNIPSGNGLEDSILHSEPIGINETENMNEFELIRYTAVIPVKDHFYVGWQVTGTDEVHVGFDVNESSNGNIFVRLDDSWSSYLNDGALMIRPIMKRGNQNRFTGIEPDYVQNSNEKLKVYPNPTTGKIHLEKSVERVQLFNQLGSLVKEQFYTRELDLGDLEPGMYILQSMDQGMIQTTKVVRSH